MMMMMTDVSLDLIAYLTADMSSLHCIFYTICTGPDLSILKAPLAAAFSPFLVLLFPTQPMACGVKDQSTTPGTPCPTLFSFPTVLHYTECICLSCSSRKYSYSPHRRFLFCTHLPPPPQEIMVYFHTLYCFLKSSF